MAIFDKSYWSYSLVPFADINLIRFYGSRFRDLSPLALRQVKTFKFI